MLRHTSDIKGYAIHASDGQIGSVSDYLFDDQTWLVRWLVVDTGHWLPGRKVLLPPSALGHVDHIARQFNVRLTKAEVEASPDIAADGTRHVQLLRLEPLLEHRLLHGRIRLRRHGNSPARPEPVPGRAA
jgi:hypothetical protein